MGSPGELGATAMTTAQSGAPFRAHQWGRNSIYRLWLCTAEPLSLLLWLLGA